MRRRNQKKASPFPTIPTFSVSSAMEPPPIQNKLPKPIFHDILSRQPIPTLLDCKLVSRSWLAAINDPSFHTLHLSTEESDAGLFLLAFSDWPKPKLQLADLGAAPEEITAKTVKIQVLPDFELVGSCNGILCFYITVSDDPLYLYNPFSTSKTCTQLPKLEIHSTICRVVFGFGFHRRSNQYKVVKVVYYKLPESVHDFSGGNPEAFVIGKGDEQWRKLGGIAHILLGPTSEATVNGRLHWRKREGVVSFDMETEEFKVVAGPKDCSSFDHLASLRGCLSGVVLSGDDGSVGVWVMRRYGVDGSWSKEFVIPRYEVPRRAGGGAPPTRRRKNGVAGRLVKVLWEFEDGRVVIVYRGRCVAVYDRVSGGFEEVCVGGLPEEFQAFVHVGSLVSVDAVWKCS